MDERKRILADIYASDCSVSKEALKAINAINENSPLVKQRLYNIARDALEECHFDSHDKEVVKSWLE